MGSTRVRDLLDRLEERVVPMGHPAFREAGIEAWARQIRDFQGKLAMAGAARDEPEGEIVASNPRVRAAWKAAVTALAQLGRAVLDAEQAIDITPGGDLAVDRRAS